MREELLEVLAEPKTGARLELRNAKGNGKKDEIEEGTLVSTETGREYPIVRKIPRFVDPSNYTASFGMQWNKFRDVQLDSDTRGAHSRLRFDAETGWFEEHLKDKWVLDAGCGAGRFAEIAASRGAKLIALDMSSAVDAVRITLERKGGTFDVIQGSILEPPLRRASVDFGYCIGVIQHTPAPPEAIKRIVETVKPGGGFAFSIYSRRPWTKLNAKYLVRPITKRLPRDTLLSAIETVMPVAFPVAEKLFAVPKLGRVAQFMLPVAVYIDERPGWGREERYQEAILDTFDMLSPAFDSPMTWQEVESALRSVDATSFHFNTRSPINVVGRR